MFIKRRVIALHGRSVDLLLTVVVAIRPRCLLRRMRSWRRIQET